jgi:hypothetical protein
VSGNAAYYGDMRFIFAASVLVFALARATHAQYGYEYDRGNSGNPMGSGPSAACIDGPGYIYYANSLGAYPMHGGPLPSVDNLVAQQRGRRLPQPCRAARQNRAACR